MKKTIKIDNIDMNRASERQFARVYIENQVYTQMFPLSEGFAKGTIFPELYQPYKLK